MLTLKETIRDLQQSWAGPGRIESVRTIEDAERKLGVRLPADYKSFLMWSDGGEVLRQGKYFRFYRLSEVLEFAVSGLPDNLIEFGTDDSDGFGFDTTVRADSASYPILRYPLGGTREESEPAAVNFVDLLRRVVAGHPSVTAY